MLVILYYCCNNCDIVFAMNFIHFMKQQNYNHEKRSTTPKRCIKGVDFWLGRGVLYWVRLAGLKKNRRVGMGFSIRQVRGNLAGRGSLVGEGSEYQDPLNRPGFSGSGSIVWGLFCGIRFFCDRLSLRKLGGLVFLGCGFFSIRQVRDNLAGRSLFTDRIAKVDCMQVSNSNIISSPSFCSLTFSG